MKNILNKFTINSYTYLFLAICAFCGYLKNMIIIFSICLVHELGHIFFIKLFKYEIIRVEILPFGGFTTINKRINSSINKDLLISLGGIISELILIMFVIILKKHFNVITYNLLLEYNFILIFFNLIPIIPLDGSKIFHLIFEKFFSYHLAYYLNFYLSLITLGIFTYLNYLYHLDNYFIITFLIYKIICYYKNYKYEHHRFLLERCLYDLEYKKIDNHTKSINSLKKEVYHYFKKNNHYIKESTKIIEDFRR